MSKELTPLKALEKIKDSLWNIYAYKDIPHKECPNLETYLNGIYHFDIIEKSLKVLEIIKETPIFAWYITIYKDAYEMVADAKGFRTNNSVEELQEKFDLLKEVLNNAKT